MGQLLSPMCTVVIWIHQSNQVTINQGRVDMQTGHVMCNGPKLIWFN